MRAYIVSRLRSWHSSGEDAFLTARHSVAFSQLSIKQQLRHCAACFSKTSSLDLWKRRKNPAGCGTGKEHSGWCSHTPWGQEFWLIVAQWIWNLRLELGHVLHPTFMRTTEFAPASTDESAETVSDPVLRPVEPVPIVYGPPQWARPSYTKGFAGADFALQPDGTLRCPADRPLYPQERRPEHNGSLRVLYAARIGHCRACPLREQCQESATTIKARRVSAVYWPISSCSSVSDGFSPAPEEASFSPLPHPVLWGDWQRCFHRREVVKLLRHQRVDIELAETAPPAQSQPIRLISRAKRAHWRLSWAERLARNARPKTAPEVSIKLFGVPDTFATVLGLRIA